MLWFIQSQLSQVEQLGVTREQLLGIAAASMRVPWSDTSRLVGIGSLVAPGVQLSCTRNRQMIHTLVGK